MLDHDQIPTVRACPGRLRALSGSYRRSTFYGDSVWERRALNTHFGGSRPGQCKEVSGLEQAVAVLDQEPGVLPATGVEFMCAPRCVCSVENH